ncbi:hypothetical protein GXW82_23220 [Streptacidiphilus sp. 4-A2]|nr:hypothetical protein [Streptacidiphilus sp. 4-A2]
MPAPIPLHQQSPQQQNAPQYPQYPHHPQHPQHPQYPQHLGTEISPQQQSHSQRRQHRSDVVIVARASPDWRPPAA